MCYFLSLLLKCLVFCICQHYAFSLHAILTVKNQYNHYLGVNYACCCPVCLSYVFVCFTCLPTRTNLLRCILVFRCFKPVVDVRWRGRWIANVIEIVARNARVLWVDGQVPSVKRRPDRVCLSQSHRSVQDRCVWHTDCQLLTYTAVYFACIATDFCQFLWQS